MARGSIGEAEAPTGRGGGATTEPPAAPSASPVQSPAKQQKRKAADGAAVASPAAKQQRRDGMATRERTSAPYFAIPKRQLDPEPAEGGRSAPSRTSRHAGQADAADQAPAPPARLQHAADGGAQRRRGGARDDGDRRGSAGREPRERGTEAPRERGEQQLQGQQGTAGARAEGRPPSRQQQQEQWKERPVVTTARHRADMVQRLLERNGGALVRSIGRLAWSSGPAALPSPAAEPPDADGRPAGPAGRAGGWSPPSLAAAEERGPLGFLAPGEPPSKLPSSILFGRMMVTKNETLAFSLTEGAFVSNNSLDIDGLNTQTMCLLHSLDERLVYGCWVAQDWGYKQLGDSSRAGFPYHTRVRLLHGFDPIPDCLLDGLVERKRSPKDGSTMKFFEKHLNARQCEQVWEVFCFYGTHGRLREEDCDLRFRNCKTRVPLEKWKRG